MARYVVLEFADNADADDFVDSINGINEGRRQMRQPFTSRIVGVFVKPGRTCICPDRANINYGDKNRKHGIARGAKFGWWVCTRCKRPRAAGHQLVNQVTLSDTYEGVQYADTEFCLTELYVTGIHTSQISRPKRLRLRKPKGE